MTFNKIESGMMKLTKADVPIQTYVKDVVNTFAAESREKGIEIEIRDIHRSTEKTNKGLMRKEVSIMINKFTNSEKDKAMEQGRTRWVASTRRLVMIHPFDDNNNTPSQYYHTLSITSHLLITNIFSISLPGHYTCRCSRWRFESVRHRCGICGQIQTR